MIEVNLLQPKGCCQCPALCGYNNTPCSQDAERGKMFCAECEEYLQGVDLDSCADRARSRTDMLAWFDGQNEDALLGGQP